MGVERDPTNACREAPKIYPFEHACTRHGAPPLLFARGEGRSKLGFMRTRTWLSMALGLCSVVAAATPISLQSSAVAAEAPANDPDSGAELIGTPAPAWSFDRWLRSRPMNLRALRGKVVLMRWWTEQCHFCRSTLPVIEQARKDHADLVVIGVFHPKPPRPVSDRHIEEIADHLGYEGPIAVDQKWKTLDRYWLAANPERNWTSVSFLIDREGRIRWVHGGGEFHPSQDPAHAKCDRQYRDFERALATLLAESPQVGAQSAP